MRVTVWSILGCIGILTLAVKVDAQELSPLQNGKWAKFAVSEDGIYKIDATLLRSSGFDPNSIDPRNISIYSNGTGMLPQANDAPRINKLREISIKVIGESDGAFNPNDYILFFGQNPDTHYYNVQKDIFYYENNLYSDKNYYYLTVSGQAGKRMGENQDLGGAFPVVNTFNDFVYHEVEKYNELKSGRDWFGEQFDLTTELTLKFDIEGIVNSSAIKIVSRVMAQSFNPASFQLSINNANVLTQPIAAIANTQYGIKGRLVADTIALSASSVNAASGITQTFAYKYNKGSTGRSIGYLDHLLVNVERNLKLYGNQTLFRSAASLTNTESTFEIDALSANALIWDVTDPFDIKNQSFQLVGSKGVFSTSTSQLKTFLVTSGNNIKSPIFDKVVPSQNLHGGLSTDLLIVTHPDFKSEAMRLANHRQSHNGLKVLAVTPEEIYNDYSGGKQDPAAIRDFAKELYSNGLDNILLFGRCSYDFKNRVNKNTNFVPTYESRNSLSPLETYSSDDYFAFLESNEGEWIENSSGDHTLDVGVGRLPVKTLQEAKAVVDKLINYDINPKAFGPWRKEILFVADDGDFNLHQSDADKLAKDIEAGYSQFNTQKLYLDAFKQISRPSGQISPDARNALRNTLKKGTLIVNFTGHGSEKIWLQERILDEELISEWSNKNIFPLLVTATCEFGRHDDPGQISSSELALTKPDGGAIGLVTAARPVNAATNAFLNKAFYESLFIKQNGEFRDLGAIFRETKNNSANGVSNRNFSLLGDPSMKLAMANNEILVTNISTADGSDTLKALSKVHIEGEIITNGIKNENFNGVLNATLKDKEFSFNTLGDENPIFTYKNRSNKLFRGEATITNGHFQLEFILPKNIAYQVGVGKLSLYASNNDKSKDAIGGDISFKIGESEIDDGSDSSPPLISLYLGDTTFVNGGIISSSTQVFARISDDSGVNIANYGIGNSLTVVLDDDQVFEVGDYFTSDIDSPASGTLTYPLENLVPGKHTIVLKAWDVHNNPATAKVNFVVTDGSQIVMENLINYPNPFSDFTTIQFAHNRAGDDLEVFASIVDLSGQPVSRMTYLFPASQYMVTLPQWDGTNSTGTKLSNGIYLLRVCVRSLLDGSKNERISKLIILN